MLAVRMTAIAAVAVSALAILPASAQEAPRDHEQHHQEQQAVPPHAPNQPQGQVQQPPRALVQQQIQQPQQVPQQHFTNQVLQGPAPWSPTAHQDFQQREVGREADYRAERHAEREAEYRAERHAEHEAYERHVFRERELALLSFEEAEMWRRGVWAQEWYNGRYGWWWTVGGTRYFYEQPVYPYPTMISEVIYDAPPTVVEQPVPVTPQYAPPAPSVYYWCDSPRGYSNTVSYCSVPWRAVPAAQ